MTLPKKGLKARPYSMDLEDHIVTLPKRGLKTRPYSMDMEKKDLKKLTKGQLIKLLLKKVDNDPFKDEVAQEPTKRIKPTPPPRNWKMGKRKTQTRSKCD